ncbi:MAG: CPBP family intramembrane metalloprotease [Anaerolineae bacterium]|jgi:membrane protease YdiL (CAAX protease family)
MSFPLQLIAFSIPALVYIAVRRWRGEKWSEILEKIGWQGNPPVYFLWAFGVMILVAGLGWLALQAVPSEVLQDPSINTSDYAGWTVGVTSFLLAWLREAIYVALGEEILFRGLLGGWLVRRLGFAIGNTIQAFVFIIPHLLLLLVSPTLWPVIIIQLMAAWLFGWLRYRSNSILPGWFAHSLANAFGALAAMG